MAIFTVVSFPVVAALCFGLGIAGSYGMGKAFPNIGTFANWLPAWGLVAAIAGVWLYRRALRASGSVIRRHIVRTGQSIPGKVHDADWSLRTNPRGPNMIVFTLVIWFPTAPDDPRLTSRELSSITKRFAEMDPGKALDALRAKYVIGTPVTVYRGRRGLVFTTDLEPRQFPWYQLW